MNPSGETGLSLPPPMPEQAPVSGHGSEMAAPAPEKAPAVPERAPSAGQAMPVIAPPAIPPTTIPVAPPVASQDGVMATSQTVTPVAADDSDLIEKEWVNKAKQIVEHTRDDPYQQSEQLTVVKADYMKKRYDKSIKLSK